MTPTDQTTPAPKAGKRERAFANPYLLLVLTTLFWGANAVAGKLAAGSIPPFTLTTIRWVGASAILYFLARPYLADALPVLRKRWRYLFLCGATGFTLFNSALYGALHFTSAINVAIEQSATPMVIMLGTYLLYRERVTWLQIVGVVFSIAGVLVTATHGDPGALLRLDMNIGDAIMLIAVCAYAAYSIALRHKPEIPWQVFMLALAISAMIASLPGFVFEVSTGRYPVMNWITPSVIAFVIIFPSLISQIFYVRAVGMIGANRAGLFMNLIPVWAALLSILILGERFLGYQAIGLALVIGGIGLAEWSARRRKAALEGENLPR